MPGLAHQAPAQRRAPGRLEQRQVRGAGDDHEARPFRILQQVYEPLVDLAPGTTDELVAADRDRLLVEHPTGVVNGERRLVEHRAARPLDVAALVLQPELEAGARPEHEALEQLGLGEAAGEHRLGLVIERANELRLPAVPHAGPDRADIDDGQHRQQPQKSSLKKALPPTQSLVQVAMVVSPKVMHSVLQPHQLRPQRPQLQ